MPTLFDREVTYDTGRLGALSDGLFSIVLTLLVLDLKIPQRVVSGDGHVHIGADLASQIPNFVAWILSFVLLARLWIVHHGVIASLERCHVGTLCWNFVVLGFCSLLPFAAGLIGLYEWNPIAITIFSALLGLIGASMGTLSRHVAGERHLHRAGGPPIDLERLWRYQLLVVPVIAGAAIAFAWVHSGVALALWAAEPLLTTALRRRRRPLSAVPTS